MAIGRPERLSEAPPTRGDAASRVVSPEPTSPARIRWAVLLPRIYDVLPLAVSRLRRRDEDPRVLTDPPVVSAILLHLDLPHKPPPLSHARGSPQNDLLTGLLDQTPTFDPAEPDPVPDFDFDQSLPGDLNP